VIGNFRKEQNMDSVDNKNVVDNDTTDSIGVEEQDMAVETTTEVQPLNINDEEDSMIYKVVINHEEQYSIWPAYRECPKGWKDVGKNGIKSECLEYIKEEWTDMRPLSLRKKMEEMERRRPELEKEHARRIEEEKKKPKDPRDNLVNYLSEDTHPVEAGLRPEKTIEVFKEAIDRGYVHVKFTDTRGGTELGVRLDMEACDFTKANFEFGTGEVHIEGNLSLNYVRVRCFADIDLSTLKGTGHLKPIDDEKTEQTDDTVK
jgi:uncharacterized protein YbdZ (MbtH family)